MKLFRFTFLSLAVCAALSSCVKQAFDNPPDLTNYDPRLPVNATIRDLTMPYWGTTGNPSRVLGDSIIYGVVTADDKSGNFYKQIMIQDSTAGINVVIANTYLYNDYPAGRKVYIKLAGLTLINYKGTPELVYATSATGGAPTGIPPNLQDSFIVKASYPNVVTPLEVRMEDLANPNPYLCKLIKINNVEFDTSSMNKVYALPGAQAISTSRTIIGCVNGTQTGSVTLYNSGFAWFFNSIEPPGYGSITGIFTMYGTTPQLQIRDTTDVVLTQPRCQ